MKRLIAFISILILLTSAGMAATGTIRIWGTNAQNAQSNTSVSLAPQNITISTFDGNTTTFFSTVNNATDTLTFSIANQTIGRMLELRINGTVINAYQVNTTGWVSFTRIQLTSNQTYKLTPAVNQGGYNFTWSRFVNIPPLFSVCNLIGTRAYTTVYQNTNSSGMLVMTSIHDGQTSVLVNSFNPPTTAIISIGTYVAGDVTPFTYYVPPLYYYEITKAGAAVLDSWTECY